MKVQHWILKKHNSGKNEEVVNKLTSGIEALLKKYKVKIVERNGQFEFPKNRISVVNGDDYYGYEFQNVIIATGSRPIEIPGFEFNEDILDSTGLLNIKELPESLVVVGGGYIGMELGLRFFDLGSKVTVIESMDRVMNGFEKDLIKPVLNAAKKKNIEIITEAKATSYKKDKDNLVLSYEKDGKTNELETEKIAVMVGRRPNTEELSLSMAGVKTTTTGHIEINEFRPDDDRSYLCYWRCSYRACFSP